MPKAISQATMAKKVPVATGSENIPVAIAATAKR